ncbi:MAG: LysE family transporter [Saprospiraceae bacterium]|nr:LysE family transporter [Saprospiraceae bacterium]
MQYIADGVMLGLTLTILLGPIFVALTQTGVQHGLRAGIAVGSGIWISDIIVISASYYFILQLTELTQAENFKFGMGLAGGLVLIGSGLISFFKSHKGDESTPAFDAKSYFGYFTKGFAVNFINPFTFIFWIGVMTSYVSAKGINGIETILLFGTIMVTIIITDSLKVIMAKAIKSRLQLHHIGIFTKIAGVLLFIFGIVLMVRSGVIF